MDQSWEPLGTERRLNNAPNDSDYTAEKFYMGAADDKGHTAKMSLRCSTGLDSLIAALIASPEFPYKSKADFWRDAAQHRARQLMEMRGDPLAMEKLRRDHAMYIAMEELESSVRRVKFERSLAEQYEDAARMGVVNEQQFWAAVDGVEDSVAIRDLLRFAEFNGLER